MVSRMLSSFLLLFFSAVGLSVVSAFAPILPATVEINAAAPVTIMTTPTPASNPLLQRGVQNYLNDNDDIRSSSWEESSSSSSTMTLSLKERPPPPTKEEIAAKKLNFNLWFWGGGFVAPFIATVYYFGPRFWTK